MNFSKYLLIIFTIFFLNLNSYSQSFQMQYSQISAREVRFDVVYQGPSGEISLPPRGRMVSIAEQDDLNVGNGKIRVGIRVGNQDDTQTNHTIRFAYAYILPNQGGFGSITERIWYPSIKNHDAQYSLTDLSQSTNMLIFPYLTQTNNTFTFTKEQKPKFLIAKHSIEKQEQNIPITFYKGAGFDSSLENIEKIYDHLNDIFGTLPINDIVIINTPLVSIESFVQDSTMYITLPSRGTPEQFMDLMANNWSSLKPELSPRLFTMFKETVLKISKIDLSAKAEKINPSDESMTAESTTNERPQTSSVESDPSKIIVVPPKSYYERLIQTGFSNNTLIEADVASLFNNFGLLHMAWYNIGLEAFLNGVKEYFAQQTSPTKESSAPTSLTNTESFTNTELATNSEPTNTPATNTEPTKSDIELVDWNIITQNKLQEPLYTLYTTEVFRENKPLIPHIIANGNQATRNSFNIPNLTITQDDGNIVEIDWNNFRVTTTGITNGSYTLDPERQVPQQVFLDNYYTFDTNKQQIHRKILFAAEKSKGIGEINFKKHLELMEFMPTNENGFGIATGTKIYIVISHILSNAKGSLKDAIKESVFTFDPDTNTPVHIATRTRI